MAAEQLANNYSTTLNGAITAGALTPIVGAAPPGAHHQRSQRALAAGQRDRDHPLAVIDRVHQGLIAHRPLGRLHQPEVGRGRGLSGRAGGDQPALAQ